jgi:4-amino-4-deoxy-L-arabinose transferase-like glycosyltransferase
MKRLLKLIENDKLIIILSIIFIILYSINLDKFPIIFNDENWFSNPAYMLILKGNLGTTLMYGFYNMQNFTYWQPPLYLLLLSLSFKTLGFGILQGRIVSLLLGLTSMIFTYALGKELYNKQVGIIASALLTFNILFFFVSRDIRMEIAVLCFTLIAIYLIILALKKSNKKYYFLSGIVSMLAFLSHPNGLIGIITIYTTIFIYKYSNSKNILQGISHFFKEKGVYLYSLALILTIIPYIIYISLDFTSFKEQFIYNIGSSIFNPVNNIIAEPSRYFIQSYNLYLYYGLNSSLVFFIGIIAIFVFSLIGVIYALRKNKLEDKLVVSILLSQIILLAILISHKWFIYISILLPYWAIILARISYQINLNLFQKKSLKSILTISLILIFIFSNVSAIAYALYSTNNHNYSLVKSEISDYIPYNSTVIGDPDFYMFLAGNYNYYSQPNNFIPFNETSSFLALKPDYILFNGFYTENSLTTETQEYIAKNYQEIGIIPQNINIRGSPIIIYKKIH